jgi:acyl-CoA hydrolase
MDAAAMTVMPNFEPNPAFAALASDEVIARTILALGPRGITAEVVADGAAAKARVLELLPPGAEVFTSLSETMTLTGLAFEINESGRYDAMRPKLAKLDRVTQHREIRKLVAAPDFVVGSVAAITEDGQIMVASGSGSQIGHYAFEAGKVILVAGTQKIVRDAAEGLRRIEEYSLPLENARLMKAIGRPSALMKILTVRGDYPAGRTTVILVREKLGF